MLDIGAERGDHRGVAVAARELIRSVREILRRGHEGRALVAPRCVNRAVQKVVANVSRPLPEIAHRGSEVRLRRPIAHVDRLEELRDLALELAPRIAEDGEAGRFEDAGNRGRDESRGEEDEDRGDAPVEPAGALRGSQRQVLRAASGYRRTRR